MTVPTFMNFEVKGGEEELPVRAMAAAVRRHRRGSMNARRRVVDLRLCGSRSGEVRPAVILSP